MKKTTILIALLGITISIQAQQKVKLEDNSNANDFYYNNGNVGIGTSTPTTIFHIKKNRNGWLQEIAGQAAQANEFIGLKILSGVLGDTNKWVGVSAIAESLYSNETGLGLYTGETERIRIKDNGNVGIGTTNPEAILHVLKNQSGWLQEISGTAANPTDFVGLKIQSGYAGAETNKWVGMSAIAESLYSNETGLGLYTGETERIRVKDNGNVGIGTTTPDMKLTVKGSIHAEEVKIDLSVPAPDYVFGKEYNLISIAEVEKYILKNSHLPEIPSAKEFAENGVLLAEMNMSLLKKIEELTLYTIQQQKEIEELNGKNVELNLINKKLFELQSRLEKLESKK